MLFNSVEFVVFFVAVLAAYWQLRGRARNTLLLVGSYLFYGLWDWRFLGLLGLSTAVDFTVGRLLGRSDEPGRRKALLVMSMVVNLGILGLFKYANFFVDSFASLLWDTGLEPNEPFLRVVLPVGISFYTFQTMSYTIDVYRRRLEPVDDLLVFATFVAYFPQLVAGPIERARVLLPQLQSDDRRVGQEEVVSGLAMILLGLFKKVVLADGVAAVADRAFDDPGSMSWLAMGAGVVAFAIQIYGDFSGYTDVARGVSRLLGIELTLNFSQPYLSRSITEFWRRWHISLSNWLRDYLYIPLGGNRRGTFRTHVNLTLTMLLGGLWHGASWNFVVWGGLHGAYLVVHRLVRGGRVEERPVGIRDLPAMVATFGLVCAAWIFFRAADFGNAWDVYRALALQSGRTSLADLSLVVATFAMTLAVDLVARRELVGVDTVLRRPAGVGSLVGLGLVGILVFSGGTPRPFVYFQF